MLDPARNGGNAASRPPVRPFAVIADALRRQAAELTNTVTHMEECAARIGLPPISASRAIFELREHASLISEAHKVFVKLTPVENTIRSILDEAA